jgi:cysteine synthase A
MPETMSNERKQLLKILGAELVLTKGELGMNGAIEEANKLHEKIENSFIPGQFTNPANPEIHTKTTALEIWKDTDGKIDALVAGAGTGGTITGIGQFLKDKNSNIEIIAVEPSESPVLSGGQAGLHKIQGIGAGFIPEILNTSIIDKIIKVDHNDAGLTSHELAKSEGILTGISGGAAMFAALEISKLKEYENKKIVVILPDTGERYLSTCLFS